jgi:branched-chain amino acid transport system ATP-binding protein
MNKILEIKDLVVDYGIVSAVKGINITVNKGTIVALLGSNGAGKSTVIKTIAGLAKAKSGKVLFKGKSIENQASYKTVKKGITLSPEGRLIFGDLSVEENLLAGGYTIGSLKKIVTDKEGATQTIKESRSKRIKRLLSEVFELFPILKERLKQSAATLSGGEQQM